MKIHIVKKGDTLYELSKKYGIELEKLIEMNPQIENPDQIDVGTKIKIPSPTQPVIAPVYEIVHKHVVHQGDTLWKLSKHWNVPLEAMIKANKQLKNPNALLTGEVVNIPMMDGNAPVEKAKLTAPMEKVKLTAPMEKVEITAPVEHVQEKPFVTEAIVTMPTFEAEITFEPPYAMPPMPVTVSPVPEKAEIEKQPSHHLFKQFDIPAKEAMSLYAMPVPEMHPSYDLTQWPQFPGQPVAAETMSAENQTSYVSETMHSPIPPYEAAWPADPNLAGIAPQTYHYPTGDCGCQGLIPQLALPYTYSAAPQPILHPYMGWPQTGVSPYALETPGVTMPGTGYGMPEGVVPGAGFVTPDGTLPGAGYGTTGEVVPGAAYGTTGEVVPGAAYGTTGGVVPGAAYGTTGGVVPGAAYGITGGVVPGAGYGTTGGVVPGAGYGTTGEVVPGAGYGTTGEVVPGAAYGTAPLATGYGLPYATMGALGYGLPQWPAPGVYGMADGTGYGMPYGLPYGTVPEADYSSYSARYPGVGAYGTLNEEPPVSTHEHKQGDYEYGGKPAADSFRSEAKEHDKKAGTKRAVKSGSSKKSKSGGSKVKVSTAERKTPRSQEMKSDNLPWINL